MNIQTNINSYEISVPRLGWNFALIMREHTSPNTKIKYLLFWIPFRTLTYIQKYISWGKKPDTEQQKTAENKVLTFKECKTIHLYINCGN